MPETTKMKQLLWKLHAVLIRAVSSLNWGREPKAQRSWKKQSLKITKRAIKREIFREVGGRQQEEEEL